MANQKTKGNVLEDLVGKLFGMPGVDVKVRARRRVKNPKSNRKREIDVLILANVLDEEVETVITCKNERKQVGIGKIDEFIGLLDDIGVPTERGVFVTPIGYSKNALQRAAEKGIQTFLARGLTKDRLKKAISDSFQAHLYLVARWENFFIAPYSEETGTPDLLSFNINIEVFHKETLIVDLSNLIWQCWAKGFIPNTVGRHEILFKARKEIVTATMEVYALSFVLEGHAKKTSLEDAATAQLVRSRIEMEFPKREYVQDAEIFTDESSIQKYFQEKSPSLIHRIRTPRIIHERCWWPPTKEAIMKIQKSLEKGKPISFESIEGNSLFTSWKF